MSFNARLISAFAAVCLLAALLASPHSAAAQSASQVHPITGLPLPSDEDTKAPIAKPAAIATGPKPAPAARLTKRQKALKSKEAALPAARKAVPVAEPPVGVPAPAVEPKSPLEGSVPKQEPAGAQHVAHAPRLEAPDSQSAKRKSRHAKPAAAANPTPKAVPQPTPAPFENTVHAIKLPLPPDEEPESSSAVPKVVSPPVEPKHEAPKVAPQPKHKSLKPVPTPKHETVKPLPVDKSVETVPEPKETPKPVEPKIEAPKRVEPAPAPKVEEPKAETTRPAPAEESKPTNKPPVAPVEVPTVKSTGSTVAAPRNVVVPSSVVPDELLPKPLPAPRPAKPQPMLKPRTGASTTEVTSPSSAVSTLPAVAPPKPAVPGSSVVASPKSVVPEATPTVPPTETSAEASPPPPPPGTLGHIVFQGAAPFTESELAPLTGLTIGTRPTSESLQIASSRLIETGLFYNVKASYETPNDIGTATFVLQPLPPSQLARVSFANFVWMTPTEIDETLKLLPLYRGVVPMGGNLRMAESIQATLEGALSSRGVQATMTHTLIPPSPKHPYIALEFRVTSPNVVLASASLFDIPPALVNRTLKAQTDAPKVPYNEGIAGTTISDILLEPARNAGYIGAKLWHIERKRHILNRTTVAVDYSARMDAGPIYMVRALNWEPTSVLSAAEFSRLAPLHVGQVPTSDTVAKTQQVITDAYYAQGYLEANIEAKQELDTKTGAAFYTYSAISGPQYRVHSISVQGLSPDAKQDFDAAWTMKPGDVYNEVYLLNFLNAHQNLASLKGYTFTYDRSTSPDTHLVDLSLTFKK